MPGASEFSVSNEATAIRYRDVLAVNGCAYSDSHPIALTDVFEGCRKSYFQVVVCGNATFPSRGNDGAGVRCFGDRCADTGDGSDQ